MSRRLLGTKVRVLVLTAVFTTTSFIAAAAPSVPRAVDGDNPVASIIDTIRDVLAPKTARADFCASNAAFSGRLTASSASTTAVSRITNGTVYGYISDVELAWSCTAFLRYSGVAWNIDAGAGRFDYGNLIASKTVYCNYVVNTTNYVKANGSQTCPASGAASALAVTLSAERVYRANAPHTTEGDFSFIHSDCGTTYGSGGAEAIYGSEAAPESFDPANVTNRPGANCDPLTIDSTNTTQTITYDATPPTLMVDAPATGAPIAVVPSAFYTVQFDATDAVAGFGGANGWTLQRQTATWSGSACGTFANDTATGNLVTGTGAGTNQLSGQRLAVNKCYQWVLDATDQNGNPSAAVTSGAIRTDTTGVLGLQGHLRTEGWDLGAGDSLAVSPGSGNVVISHPIVSLPIRGSSTSIGLTYNSQDGANVGFGPGWRLNVQRRLTLNGSGTVTFVDGDGSRHTFTNPVTANGITTYTRPATLYATLVKDTNQAIEFSLTDRDKSRDTFDIAGTEGVLARSEDRFGNGVSFGYVAASTRISTITDTAASPTRTINFAYDGSNRLTSITDWAYVSGGVVQTGATGSRRATRFFYDGSSNLSGWADGLNPAGSCPTGGSHLTCLTLTAGLVTAIGKTQTVETIGGVPLALGSTTRLISTQITYTGSDVTTVKDAEEVYAGGAGATFSHPGIGQTKVVRPGTPASETTYTLAAVTDTLGRSMSVKRKLGAAQIEQLTAYNATYPTEPASVTDNNGALLSTPARTTSYTYVASSLGLVARMTEPLTATTNRTTDHTYNSNNDVTQRIVALDGSGTTRTITRFCYDASCATNPVTPTLTMSRQIDNYVDGTAGNGSGVTGPEVADVTTTYQYDTACPGSTTCGQRTRETRENYKASGGSPLDTRSIGHTYDSLGNTTSEIANYIDGSVTNPGDDITPNATTNARSDLTTVFTHDTAGNPVGSADPRRAIEAALGTSLVADDFVTRSTFDALDQSLTTRLPTTAGISDCTPTPGCRTTSSVVDELGGVRQSTDPGGVVTGSEFDRLDHTTRTFEDTDGALSTPAAVTSITTYDAAGRTLTMKDRRQSAAGSTLGSADTTYDELGRATQTVDASGSTLPDVASRTLRTFDALDRQTEEITGSDAAAAQKTKTTYDLGARAVSIDDEFTCATTAYDYRDLATQTVEGLSTVSCAGGTPVTTTITVDGLGRVTLRSVDAANVPEATTYDGAGNTLVKSGTQAGVTTTSTFTLNPLDQVVVETRTGGSTSKTNYDAAGNATDRCYWQAGTAGPCLAVGTTPWTSPPTQASTTVSDARNQRVSQTSKLGASSSVATTTYDPAHNYQISGFYLPTAAGREAQDRYGYDNRHRLASISHKVCAISERPACSIGNTLTSTGSSAYGYDDNDNRTTVTESSTAGAATTRTYCYDALNRLTASKLTSTCTSAPDETYVYDDAGNRTSATASGSTRTFTHDGEGQLVSCAVPACTVTYDDAGRSATITDNGTTWTYGYDADGRLISACRSTACSGSIDRVDYRYDGSGHRVQIKETTAGGSVTTTDFRYEGDTIVEELVGGTVSRTYVTDDAGRIVEVCDPDCAGTIYVVVYNGHGDATGLWQLNGTNGAMTLANSYTYSTWGSPIIRNAAGTILAWNDAANLRLRFLYVGASDVQWDNSFGSLGLTYMHARHYSPSLGRFIQPDPTAQDENLYVYAEDSPATKADPEGTMTIPGIIFNAAAGASFEKRYTETVKRFGWTVESVRRYERVKGYGRGRYVDLIISKQTRTGFQRWRIELKVGMSRHVGEPQLSKDMKLTDKSGVPTRLVRSIQGSGGSGIVRVDYIIRTGPKGPAVTFKFEGGQWRHGMPRGLSSGGGGGIDGKLLL